MVIHTCRLRPWFSPPWLHIPFRCLPLLSPLSYSIFLICLSDLSLPHSITTAHQLSNRLSQTTMHLSWVTTHQLLHVFVMHLIPVEVILPPSIRLSPFSQVRKPRLKHFKEFSEFHCQQTVDQISSWGSLCSFHCLRTFQSPDWRLQEARDCNQRGRRLRASWLTICHLGILLLPTRDKERA